MDGKAAKSHSVLLHVQYYMVVYMQILHSGLEYCACNVVAHSHSEFVPVCDCLYIYISVHAKWMGACVRVWTMWDKPTSPSACAYCSPVRPSLLLSTPFMYVRRTGGHRPTESLSAARTRLHTKRTYTYIGSDDMGRVMIVAESERRAFD